MFFFGAILFVLYVLRLWLAGFGGLHPDEAYYWAWSKHLSFGYFDHPPMVAWLIRAGRTIVELLVPQSARETFPLFFAQIGLRLIPYFVSSVLLPLTIGKCIEITQKRTLGLTQILALITAPVFVFGPQVITPDTPFFFGWAMCLLLNLKIIDDRGPEAVPGDATPFRPTLAILAGVTLAFTAYSKHTAILALLLFSVCGVGPYNALVAAGVAAILTLPQLNWYRTTGLAESAGFVFQFKNALGSGFPETSFRRAGDLIASQFFLWSPLTFLLALGLTLVDFRRFFLPRKLRRPTGTLFLWAFAPVVFFSLTALRRNAEANWAFVGVVAALVLVISKLFDSRKWLYTITLSHLAVTIVAAFALFQPKLLADLLRPSLPKVAETLDRPSRTREFSNWDRFHTLVFEATHSNDRPIYVQSYQLLSGLLFFDDAAPNEQMGGRLRIWTDNSRKSDFHLHPEYLQTPGAKEYWIVTYFNVPPPPGCALSQAIYKNAADERPYNVIRCGF